MKPACGARRRLPAAVKFMLVLLMLAGLTYPFRMPPASQAESNDFYKTDGSDTAQVLNDASGNINCDIVGAGGVLHVNARVEVPDVKHVPILRVSQNRIDVNSVQAVFGLDADTASIAENSTESYTYLGYDVNYQLIWYDNGSLDINESGKIKVYLYEPGKVYDAAEIADMLHECGLIEGDVQILLMNDGASMLMRPMYEDIPVSNTFAFDSYTSYPNYGVSLVVEQRMDGTQLSIEGRTLGEAQIIWDSARILPPSDALNALSAHCQRDEAVDRIVLAYHVRSIYSDPFNVILYPVWEIYTQSAGSFNASIVNAITGQVEQSLLEADA